MGLQHIFFEGDILHFRTDTFIQDRTPLVTSIPLSSPTVFNLEQIHRSVAAGLPGSAGVDCSCFQDISVWWGDGVDFSVKDKIVNILCLLGLSGLSDLCYNYSTVPFSTKAFIHNM